MEFLYKINLISLLFMILSYVVIAEDQERENSKIQQVSTNEEESKNEPNKTAEISQKYSVGTTPIVWLYGIVNGSYEMRVEPEYSFGIGGFTWYFISSNWEFSIFGIGPYGRYYFNKEEDGPFAGGGISLVKYSWSGSGSSGAGTITSLGGEAGYQWRWKNFFQEATFGFALSSSIQTSDGTTANLSSGIGGIGYRLGWYF